MTEHLPAEVRALALKTLMADLDAELKLLDKPLNISHHMPGTGTYESPLDGAALGKVIRERVKPVWVMESLEQFTEYLTRESPWMLETVGGRS